MAIQLCYILQYKENIPKQEISVGVLAGKGVTAFFCLLLWGEWYHFTVQSALLFLDILKAVQCVLSAVRFLRFRTY